jgi:hypothetical protein
MLTQVYPIPQHKAQKHYKDWATLQRPLARKVC